MKTLIRRSFIMNKNEKITSKVAHMNVFLISYFLFERNMWWRASTSFRILYRELTGKEGSSAGKTFHRYEVIQTMHRSIKYLTEIGVLKPLEKEILSYSFDEIVRFQLNECEICVKMPGVDKVLPYVVLDYQEYRKILMASNSANATKLLYLYLFLKSLMRIRAEEDIRYYADPAYCLIAESTISNKTGISKRSVRDCLKMLQDIGVIHSSMSGFNKPNVYVLDSPHWEKEMREAKKHIWKKMNGQ